MIIICQKRPEYGSASVARSAKVWFGDSRCILICLSRGGGWTRPLFIPSEVEILDKLGLDATTPVFGVSDNLNRDSNQSSQP